MTRRSLLAAAVIGLLACAPGCAVTDMPGQTRAPAYGLETQDPARIGLPSPYRIFFDELKDDGDWTLIEPYGYVFRPRVNFVAWRPYQDGWWELSDYYGWVWNTNETFGWVTYHYGTWFYDSYQGWVWQPGSTWGPAWVAWVDAGDYIGWAPLAPVAYNDFGRVPDGLFTYAQVSQFSASNVGEHAIALSKLPQAGTTFHEIANVGQVNGVTFNKGPDPFTLQQRGTAVQPPLDAAKLPRVKMPATVARETPSSLQERTNRVVNEGALELRRLREQGIKPPASPPHAPLTGTSATRPKPKPLAIPDSTLSHRAARPRMLADSTLHEGSQPAPRREHKPGAPADTTR